jgi:hypothetical protein
MEIAAIFPDDRCRVVSGQSSRNPGHSSTKARLKKKIADLDPFRGENPGETAILGGQYRSSLRAIGPKTVANGSQDHVCHCRG